MNKIGVDDCHLIGNSLGGWMCWEYALRKQERINRLVLLNSAGYINDNNYPLPFVIAQTPVLRNVFNYVPKAVVRRFVRQVYYDQSKVKDPIVDRYFDLFHREGNKEAFVKIANANYIQNTHSLESLEIPVMVMWGREDKWLDVEHAYKFKRDLPNSKLIIYDEVGHVPMKEIPEKSANDVVLFLGK